MPSLVPRLCVALLGVLLLPATQAGQIAPMGSELEARLTREKDATLARVAGKVGVLLKGPVHEELTQLGHDCPIDDPAALANDEACAGANLGYASPFVIYGVRWNDLPPFRLSADEARCRHYGLKACRVEQTVRFATQPNCWLCLFKDAEKASKAGRRIIGCGKTSSQVFKGNLMTRSHFGDLQFLHAMANDAQASAEATRAKILDWLQFAWRVARGEYRADTRLRDIDNPTLREHFGCSEWTVGELYILGRMDQPSRLLPHLGKIAFGSLLHTVQDSFAAGHALREAAAPSGQCPSGHQARPPRILRFHDYGSQDGAEHDRHDHRAALVRSPDGQRLPPAAEVSNELFKLFEARDTQWPQVESYLRCVFELAPGGAQMAEVAEMTEMTAAQRQAPAAP